MSTLNHQISDTTDDGYGNSSPYFSNHDSVIAAGGNGTNTYDAYVQFPVVQIPIGAIINVAYISLCAYNLLSTPTIRIYADDNAAPTAPITYEALQGKTKTTAYVSWSPTGWSADSWYDSPSLVSLVQELVDSYDFSAGSAMQFLLWNTTSSYAMVQAYDYTGDPTKSAKLHIEYTLPSTSRPKIRCIS